MAANAATGTLIEAVPQRNRRKRLVSVYILMSNIVLGDEILPVLPDQKSMMYVTVRNGQYQYYTQAALDEAAEMENWKLQTVGYAIALDGKMQIYVNDPNNADKLSAYQDFEAWRKYAEEKLQHAFASVAASANHNESETVIETVTAAPSPAPVSTDLKMYILILLAIVLFGNLTQIIIAIVK